MYTTAYKENTITKLIVMVDWHCVVSLCTNEPFFLPFLVLEYFMVPVPRPHQPRPLLTPQPTYRHLLPQLHGSHVQTCQPEMPPPEVRRLTPNFRHRPLTPVTPQDAG